MQFTAAFYREFNFGNGWKTNWISSVTWVNFWNAFYGRVKSGFFWCSVPRNGFSNLGYIPRRKVSLVPTPFLDFFIIISWTFEIAKSSKWTPFSLWFKGFVWDQLASWKSQGHGSSGHQQQQEQKNAQWDVTIYRFSREEFRRRRSCSDQATCLDPHIWPERFSLFWLFWSFIEASLPQSIFKKSVWFSSDKCRHFWG